MDETELWVEKYRPKRFDDIVGQGAIVSRLRSYAESRNLPHLLFAGPAGTGKTTCSIVLARELFGESWKENFMELNASDERGIKIVRGDPEHNVPSKIKNFARTAPLGNASFKIIFLDESDALTPDAQSALRRTMELYSRSCRFIFSANYPGRIIDPIQSRCAVFQFSPLADADIEKCLQKIIDNEGIRISRAAVEYIVRYSRGDSRRAINTLQASAFLSSDIDQNTVYLATSTPDPKEMKQLIEYALHGHFLKARSVLDAFLFDRGMSAPDVISSMHRTVFEMDIPEDALLEIISRIGETEFHVVQGGNDRIQLESLIAQIGLIGKREDSRAIRQKTFR
ncbi:MAG: replication factor C small subunit [Candidatus Thermoplasmatota archaeon]|jgi:replication factor C small subunit|nr:replication factor C small subunit [Candidatus Sysuiplasma jiujiangense]MBX8640021.1 replication factor C small subunit [Candidatus Sysuiplasma jiujiangense]MBX8641996.1 replication factor C small subunit [Candidatus Sysuiplasma jiujiangense]MCL4317299.1 replication factor C small subunit [Candidatus Thermoplasmatota archaeon]MCL5253794.1 replication factor C small subunit [Candidatus Thermoplasmatota archaeon]